MQPLKVYISPKFDPNDDGKGGVIRVLEALIKYLPSYGFSIVETPEEADIINCHVGKYYDIPDKPVIYSNHGFYWTDWEWNKQEHDLNNRMTNIVYSSDAVTVPSKWVANAVNRGIMYPLTVINHGVELDEWVNLEGVNKGYIFYNKNRVDSVCNPNDFLKLAGLRKDLQFAGTILANPSIKPPNVTLFGVEPIDVHRKRIQQASLYLSTTLETFGNSIIESLASGVPVVGWAWGGASEIIRNGYNGYLAPYGNFELLSEYIDKALSEREKLSENAVKTVADKYQWKDKVSEYGDLFRATHTSFHKERPKLSVIMPVWNNERFVGDAIESVKTLPFDNWECIIVNDASTDNSKRVIQEKISTDSRFKYIENEVNMEVSSSRNNAIRYASGKYLTFLDSDDILIGENLSILVRELDRNRSLTLAYGGILGMSEDGTKTWENKWPSGRFMFQQQISYMNQVPITNVMRTSAFRNMGGFRSRYTRGEDALLWTMLASWGYKLHQVTNEPIFKYRIHESQKTNVESKKTGKKDSAWLDYISWRQVDDVDNGKKINNIFESNFKEYIHASLIPFGAQATPPKVSWSIKHHVEPKISIIIPVTKKHLPWLIDAIDSVVGQRFTDWEIIVINDTGLDIKQLPGAYFAKIINPKNLSVSNGQSKARNIGAYFAKGETLLFLDADDMLLPDIPLLELWKKYVETGRDRVIYGDLIEDDGSKYTYATLRKPYCGGNIDLSCLKEPIRPVTSLYPRQKFMDMGGFDDTFQIWEDWDLELTCYEQGLCSEKVDVPIFIYRRYTSVVSRSADNNTDIKETTKKLLYNKHERLYKGELEPMAKKCCGRDGVIYIKPSNAVTNSNNTTEGENHSPMGRRKVDARIQQMMSDRNSSGERVITESRIDLIFLGKDVSTRVYIGNITKTMYRFGNTDGHRVKSVFISDVPEFLARKDPLTRGPLFAKHIIKKEKPTVNAIVNNVMAKKAEAVPTKANPASETQKTNNFVEFDSSSVVPNMPSFVKDILGEIGKIDDIFVLEEWLTKEKTTKNRSTVVFAIANRISTLLPVST